MTLEQELNEVVTSPMYRGKGFVVDIRDNGAILLKSGDKITNEHTHSLSLEDSDRIANIIRMSINEAK